MNLVTVSMTKEFGHIQIHLFFDWLFADSIVPHQRQLQTPVVQSTNNLKLSVKNWQKLIVCFSLNTIFYNSIFFSWYCIFIGLYTFSHHIIMLNAFCTAGEGETGWKGTRWLPQGTFKHWYVITAFFLLFLMCKQDLATRIFRREEMQKKVVQNDVETIPTARIVQAWFC